MSVKGELMPRPKKTRFVSAYPVITEFVPRGQNVSGEILMTLEEFEAIRLSDFEHLDQEAAAGMMGVSRHTFGVFWQQDVRSSQMPWLPAKC